MPPEITTATAPVSAPLLNPPDLADSSITPTVAIEETSASQIINGPKLTFSRSDHYTKTLASVVARASLTASDRLVGLFVRELNPPPTQTFEAALCAYTNARIIRKLTDHKDTFIAESANFAAATAWEPMSIHAAQRTETLTSQSTARDRFVHDLRALQRERLWPVVAAFDRAQGQTDGAFWHLCLTARDPGREHVAGAVRGVIVPVMQKLFAGEGMEVDGQLVGRTPVVDGGKGGRAKTPIWLEASSEHSREVYRHFGFRDAGVVNAVGADDEKVPIWGMMYTGESDLIPL